MLFLTILGLLLSAMKSFSDFIIDFVKNALDDLENVVVLIAKKRNPSLKKKGIKAVYRVVIALLLLLIVAVVSIL